MADSVALDLDERTAQVRSSFEKLADLGFARESGGIKNERRDPFEGIDDILGVKLVRATSG